MLQTILISAATTVFVIGAIAFAVLYAIGNAWLKAEKEAIEAERVLDEADKVAKDKEAGGGSHDRSQRGETGHGATKRGDAREVRTSQ